MRVGVLTGGGDCPGLNAVIRAVTRKGRKVHDDTIIGFHDGWSGVLERRYEELTIASMRGTLPRGGTVLGTSRINPWMTDDGPAKVKENLDDLAIDALVVIGGEGTLACAREVHTAGLANVVGVPKTIDNDVGLTEMTFGFSTAVDIATEAIGRLHTTAESHDRVIVVEVMGRHVGHIACWAGMAGGATVTLIPEHPFDIQAVAESLTRRHEGGKYASIVVVAEGALPIEGSLNIPEPEKDQYGHQKLGGIANVVAAEITERTGYETRVTVLGHVQRGGTPNAFDRVLCTRYGIAAIDAVHDGDFGKMVALQCGSMTRVTLEDATASLKYVSDELYATAQNFFA